MTPIPPTPILRSPAMCNPAPRPRARRLAAVVVFVPLVLLAPLLGARQEAAANPRLEAALASIDADRLSADLHFFASDEMRGRDTPSLEQRVAARFLRARLERLGIAPGAEHGYFQTYRLLSKSLDPEASGVVLDGGGVHRELKFGTDYFFTSTRSLFPLDLETDAVFCGTGSRREYGEVKAEGRWAVVFAAEGVSASRRRRNAERAGAAGLIVLPDPEAGGDPFPDRCANATRAARKGQVLYPSAKTMARAEKPGFPELLLSRAAGTTLFEACAARGTHAPGQWRPRLGTLLGVVVRDRRTGPGFVDVENVAGFWKGEDPELWKEVIILSAHYDHVGVRNGEIYNGADDNGSGSIGLLAIAEALTHYGPLRRSVLLLWVSGEEKGLFGSRAWTENPWLPEGARPMCDLNIDMIGRNAPDYLTITPTRERKEYNFLTRMAELAAPLEGFAELGSADAYWSRSDHANFSRNLGIPVAFLFSDVHEDYHRPTDTPDKIDYDKMRRVCRLVVRMLDGLQADHFDG